MKSMLIVLLSAAMTLSGASQAALPPEEVTPPAADVVEETVLPAEPEVPAEPEQPYVYHAQVPILMYHEVNDNIQNNLYLSVSDFRSHLDYFEQHNITPVSMEQLYDHWVNEKPLPEKPIVLTFDDGYRSMYTTVFPLLRERGWSGTFYCISDCRWSQAFVTEAMMQEMAAGGMEIGSHTVSHVEVTSLTGSKLTYELEGSKEALSGVIGSEVTQFCYPVGRNNAASRAAVEKAGYHCAVTTDYGFAQPSQGLYALKRIRISTGCGPKTLASMLAPLGY